MISERLKEVRALLGYSDKQKEFAELLDMKQGSYSDVERGKTKSISKKLIRNLYIKFGVNEEFLLYGKLPILLNEKRNHSSEIPEQLNQLLALVNTKDKLINDLISQQGELIQQQKKLIEAILNLTRQNKIKVE